jgi:hypothetical protein
MLVVGDRESTEGQVSVRSRTDGDLGAFPLEMFVAWAKLENSSKGAQNVRRLSGGPIDVSWIEHGGQESAVGKN